MGSVKLREVEVRKCSNRSLSWPERWRVSARRDICGTRKAIARVKCQTRNQFPKSVTVKVTSRSRWNNLKSGCRVLCNKPNRTLISLGSHAIKVKFWTEKNKQENLFVTHFCSEQQLRLQNAYRPLLCWSTFSSTCLSVHLCWLRLFEKLFSFSSLGALLSILLGLCNFYELVRARECRVTQHFLASSLTAVCVCESIRWSKFAQGHHDVSAMEINRLRTRRVTKAQSRPTAFSRIYCVPIDLDLSRCSWFLSCNQTIGASKANRTEIWINCYFWCSWPMTRQHLLAQKHRMVLKQWLARMLMQRLQNVFLIARAERQKLELGKLKLLFRRCVFEQRVFPSRQSRSDHLLNNFSPNCSDKLVFQLESGFMVCFRVFEPDS